VFNDGANETTEELSFKLFNSADPDIESHQIPIDGEGNKSWENLRAMAKEDLDDFGKYLSVDKISDPELVAALQ